jgi:hypothetical protein
MHIQGSLMQLNINALLKSSIKKILIGIRYHETKVISVLAKCDHSGIATLMPSGRLMQVSTTSQSVINLHVRHGHSINARDGIDEQSLEEWQHKRLARDSIADIGKGSMLSAMRPE